MLCLELQKSLRVDFLLRRAAVFWFRRGVLHDYYANGRSRRLSRHLLKEVVRKGTGEWLEKYVAQLHGFFGSQAQIISRPRLPQP